MSKNPRKLNAVDKRILHLIGDLATMETMASVAGLYDVLKGYAPENTYGHLPSFGCAPSLRARALSSRIRTLTLDGYLQCFYSAKEKERYFRLSPKGAEAVVTNPVPEKKESPIKARRAKFISTEEFLK